jgi:glycosyltransferase involved in cell wall biosynthesis
VFVTQNGDWPAQAGNSEYRFFGCEGLVCTNPDYLENNKDRWTSTLIPNGVNLPAFTPGPQQRSSFGLPEQPFIILMVSAMIPSKRVADGVLAVSKIPDAHLVVAGDGPERNTISRMAHDLLPGRFTQLSVTADRMPALYRSADIFLHLSREESFGNIFVEAMAVGLPIVGHDSRRLRWIVGDNEHLVDTEDQPRLIRALELARADSPERRKARSKRAEGFGWDRIAKHYAEFIERVVKTFASGR